MLPRAPTSTAIAFLLASACTSSGDPPTAPRAAPRSSRVSLTPIARDSSGAPRMLLALGDDPSPPAGTSAEQARAHLLRHAAALGFARADLSALEVARVVRAGKSGAAVTTFRPRVAGVEVVDGDTRVLTRGDGSLAVISGLPPAVRTRPHFSLSPSDAFSRALTAELGKSFAVTDRGQLPGGYRNFTAAGASLLDPCRVKPVIAPAGGSWVAAYQVEIQRQDGVRAVTNEYRIDAQSGAVIRKRSLTLDAEFQYRAYVDADGRPLDGALADVTPHPSGVPDLIVRDPVAANLVTMDGFNQPGDPWLEEGARTTRGNNVHAYADLQGVDGLDSGDVRDTISAPGVFDWTYNPARGPLDNGRQSRAVTTHLFYVTNYLHDWWYDSGFDEYAGNAQKVNYGRGGEENDPLLAEAQDAALDGTRDNANMSTPADGASPRMQMYVFSNQDARRLTIEPSGQKVGAALADFGPQNFNLTGQLQLASPASGCTAIGNVDGRIALINAGGTCTSEDKVRRAQLGGAIAAIIAFNKAGELPPDMENTPATNPTIPSFIIRKDAGDDLKARMADGPVNLRLFRGPGVEKDSSLDTAVIAHEWGHYIHLRLQSCGTSMCYAESEGWGDFLALHTEIRQGDDPNGTYGLGHFAITDFDRLYGNGDAAYFGIRRAPYTRDMTKNGFSFRHIQAGERLPDQIMFELGGPNNEVHNAGEIWALLMFEAYQQLLDRSRDGDYSFDEARRRMSDYVVGGLALAPGDSTYLEMRDAILAAAAAADPDDAMAMAEGFARRGAGSCAISPPVDSFSFRGVEEDFEQSPRLGIGAVSIDDSVTTCDADGSLDAEETGLIRVNVLNPGTAPLEDAEVTLSNLSEGLTLPDGATKSVPSIPAFGSAEVTFPVALAATSEIVDGSVDVSVTAASSCEETAASALAVKLNIKIIPHAATVDDVEAEATAWTLTGGETVWSRMQKANGNHVWHAEDAGSPTDGQMVSPEVTVSDAGPLVLHFTHRYSFEPSWDGGVIEITTDGGTTWQDVSDLGADPGYDSVLNTDSGNALGGRNAYTAESAGYPARLDASIDLGTSLAGQTIQIRFRAGSDAIIGAPGWEIDDIGFDNVVDPPFPSVEPDTECEGVPTPDAGPGDADAGSEPGSDAGGNPGTPGDDDDDDGGCGCRSGGGSGGATAILVALGLVPWTRRRRRRA